MPNYLVIDADWLDREIGNARVLTEHAKETGKPVAIAAAAVRLESLKEVLKLGVPALPPGEGGIPLSVAAPPAGPARGE